MQRKKSYQAQNLLKSTTAVLASITVILLKIIIPTSIMLQREPGLG
jgi:hypothetical protein